ncbi:DUF983 domain-containing protein [Phenylobacterium sp.]|uniref:DUF983 domain-containing protein n=1 Tax=Phenylobacterium sp. TaxID=1871053 RepID=UPI0025D88A94|nr:DUF983 domain-containing protein [Phenylobacterium sp.]
MGKPHPLLAGLAGRCPNCGEGHLFEGFLEVAPSCAACGYDLSKADSGDGPAVFITMIAGFLVAFAALITEFTIHPPIWVHLIIWLPLTLILSLGLIRPLKGLMLAAQFMNRASEARHDD